MSIAIMAGRVVWSRQFRDNNTRGYKNAGRSFYYKLNDQKKQARTACFFLYKLFQYGEQLRADTIDTTDAIDARVCRSR